MKVTRKCEVCLRKKEGGLGKFEKVKNLKKRLEHGGFIDRRGYYSPNTLLSRLTRAEAEEYICKSCGDKLEKRLI